MNLKNKVALITGGSGRIGKAIGLVFKLYTKKTTGQVIIVDGGNILKFSEE